jgi:integrase
LKPETYYADRLPRVLAKNGKMKVGRAIIRPYRNNGFELDLGYVMGKRFRLYRYTITAAIRTAMARTVELWKHGQLASALTSAQRVEAAQCYQLLKPIAGSIRLFDIVTDYLKRHPSSGNYRTVQDVVKELVSRKARLNRKARYVEDLGRKLTAFAEFLPPDKHIASVTVDDLEGWYATKPHWSPVTVRTFSQALNVIFNFAIRRGYRSDNPVQSFDLPIVDEKEPVILTVDQMRHALVQAMHGPAELRPCIPWLAIGGFAGVRPEEIEKLDWKDVSFAHNTITVLASNAKTRSRRVVDMAANLVMWLKPIARAAGAVLTQPLAILRPLMRNAMGFAKWPADCLRHSFGSYHFAKFKSASDTVQQMGHTDGGRIFFNHYRALVHPVEADRWWKIIPTRLLTA